MKASASNIISHESFMQLSCSDCARFIYFTNTVTSQFSKSTQARHKYFTNPSKYEWKLQHNLILHSDTKCVKKTTTTTAAIKNTIAVTVACPNEAATSFMCQDLLCSGAGPLTFVFSKVCCSSGATVWEDVFQQNRQACRKTRSWSLCAYTQQTNTLCANVIYLSESLHCNSGFYFSLYDPTKENLLSWVISQFAPEYCHLKGDNTWECVLQGQWGRMRSGWGSNSIL